MISVEQARNFALHHQLYRFRKNRGKDGTLDAICKLAYVQIDTINVVERAHHHTLFNRVTDYKTTYLDDLLAKDKAIFEYWGHAASFLPRSELRYFIPRMKNFPNNNAWERYMWEKSGQVVDHVLKRIEKEGPLTSADFEHQRLEPKSRGWWDWKPAKVTLELLMWKGDLCVVGRRNFQRLYDLTSRAIPDFHKLEIPAPAELALWMIRTTIQAHGIASLSDINKHIPLTTRQEVSHALADLLFEKEVIEIRIHGLKEPHYIFAAHLDNLDVPFQRYNLVWLLSPFDNIVIFRSRLKKLFGFDYAIECYLPSSKRIYGYWNLPILYKERFVGRLDPKADRKKSNLIINSLFIEKAIWKSKSFQNAFEKALADYTAFNQCKTYTISKINLS